ncbi:MAG: NHLP family bacteriocin export ABC transporter permease/ATPase subunit, partial [Clostridia bacterium]|nr:NHLP family bacteriocin export ABC transporter permease/ATPase subunit [Clostridia bacterium]
MGIFDDQIKERLENDNDVFSESFLEMSGVVMGKRALADILKDQSRQAKNAIFEILSYYHIAPQELPSNVRDVSDQLDYLLRPTGIMRREVKLDGAWYRNGFGPLLATTVDGAVIALIPGRISGYTYFNAETGKTVRVTKKNCAQICDEALCFYKHFPQRAMTAKDLFRYFADTVTAFDWLLTVLASLAATLIGTLLTYANSLIYGQVLDVGEMNVFLAAFTLLIGVSVSQLLMNVVKTLVTTRINTKMSVAVEAASMMRLLSLPAAFFKQFSSGDLSNRLVHIKMLCTSVSSILVSGGLTALFSIAYVFQIFNYAPALMVPALIVILVTLAIFLVVSSLQMQNFKQMMDAESKESGLVYSLISGIQKIKLSGAEKRSFSKWAKAYKQTAEKKYNPQTVVKLVNAIILAVNTLGTAMIYYFASRTGVEVSQFMAFSVAYGMVSGAFMTLISTSSEISQIKPGLELIRPILEATPEVSEEKHVITRLSGAIELNNITFRYSES